MFCERRPNLICFFRLTNFKDSNYLKRSKRFDFFWDTWNLLKAFQKRINGHIKATKSIECQINFEKHFSSNFRSVRLICCLYLSGPAPSDKRWCEVRTGLVRKSLCNLWSECEQSEILKSDQRKGVFSFESDNIIHSKKECKSKAIPNDWIICLLCFSWVQVFKPN